MKTTPEKIYKFLRFIVYLIPLAAFVTGAYLVFFPIDVYRFRPDQPDASKFTFAKNPDKNEMSFGIFPLRESRFAQVSVSFEKNAKACPAESPSINLRKTYKSFLSPDGEVIADAEKLHGMIFADNPTKYPNGSLLHVKSTNQVFFISRGQKMLFPGPEIFEAFGYSFDNLTDVDAATINDFKDAQDEVFLWTMSHPDGTILESFPSHRLFLVFEGKKYPIGSEEILKEVWPDFYAIAVGDESADNTLTCNPRKNSSGSVSCQFDLKLLSGIGRYHYYMIDFPQNCPVASVQPDYSEVRYVSEKSLPVFKQSLREIASSIFSRYFYKISNAVK